jgi:hypothetical protein
LLPPVVCTPPILFVAVAPAAPVPPIPVDEPYPLPELESVPPKVDVEEPLLPKADPEFPPKGELDDPEFPPKGELDDPEFPPKGELDDPEPKDDPLLPNPDPDGEPRDEPPLPSELPEAPDDPKGDEDPNELAVPVPVPVVAPVGVMPFCGTAWPNKPMVGTFCSPL